MLRCGRIYILCSNCPPHAHTHAWSLSLQSNCYNNSITNWCNLSNAIAMCCSNLLTFLIFVLQPFSHSALPILQSTGFMSVHLDGHKICMTKAGITTFRGSRVFASLTHWGLILQEHEIVRVLPTVRLKIQHKQYVLILRLLAITPG